MELIIAYFVIAAGVAIGLITDAKPENDHYHPIAVIIGSIFLGLIWPLFWVIKITQKLGD